MTCIIITPIPDRSVPIIIYWLVPCIARFKSIFPISIARTPGSGSLLFLRFVAYPTTSVRNRTGNIP